MDDQTLRLLARIREAMRNRYTFQYGGPQPQTSTAIPPPQSGAESTSEPEPAEATPAREDHVVYPTMVTVDEPTETTEVLPSHTSSAKATEVIVMESTQAAMLKPNQATVVEPMDNSVKRRTPTKTTALEYTEDDTTVEIEPASTDKQRLEAELKPTEGAESNEKVVEGIETAVVQIMEVTRIESAEREATIIEPTQSQENQEDAAEPKQLTAVGPNKEIVEESKQLPMVGPNEPVAEPNSESGIRNVTTSMAELLWSVAESSEETLVESNRTKSAKPKRATMTSTVVAENAGLGTEVVPSSEQFPEPVKTGIRVAMIGQSPFAVDVMERLQSNGHIIVGVFTITDTKNREDPLAQAARESNIPVFKFKSWRIKGQTKPEVLELYKSVDAELNVLAYCSQYIPMEAINYPTFKSICYHPSILPRHRGASAINWTLISGDAEAGFSIFWPDEGLDTGPVLLQEKIKVQPSDTVDTLYRKFLYPAGVTAMEAAVDMIAQGIAPTLIQNETLATYGPLLNKPELLTIDFKKKGKELHNFIRGLDSVPGARCFMKTSTSTQFEETQVFGSTLWKKAIPSGTQVTIENGPNGILHEDGILLFGSDGVAVNIVKVKIGGRFKQASALEQAAKQQEVKFSDEEEAIVGSIKKVWEAILKIEIEDHTDFFAAGAGSMDVVRLIEEVKELMDMYLDNEDIFMSPVFDEFCKAVILKSRQTTTIDGMMHVEYNGTDLVANNRVIRVPTQMFIDGKFVDAENGKTTDVINPTDESVICKVPAATVNDVNKAVAAAKKAFEEGEWSKISARERGNLLLKLSYFMEDSKEQLATLEAVDSGAVYTLALKTHVGMSIETWRYFGGWADKIQGSTIPISDARPNKNLSFTKKEPIGVCGLIIPWNYPLMMLSWKMAACLAAGNTVVIKPAQVCPLTALKFAELAVRAGIPPGVINIVTGSGSGAGNAIAAHPDVRKVGFTGSTEIGKVIMQTCTENLKKVSLELGGKSPLVIFSDCDMDKAVKLGMQSVFFNKGENCIAAGRIFVEASIYTEFIHRVLKETKKIVIGDPLNRATAHGPQNHLAHLKKLEEFVQAGLNDGARLVYGGKRLVRPGYFFQPTILADVEDNMFVAREESFGPIMCISKFDDGDIDGVLKRANNTEYGLASGVFTQDISKALKFADKIESGTVFINTYNKTDVAAPFGGFKQSGFGKDLGQEALNEYLKTKTVTIEY